MTRMGRSSRCSGAAVPAGIAAPMAVVARFIIVRPAGIPDLLDGIASATGEDQAGEAEAKIAHA